MLPCRILEMGSAFYFPEDAQTRQSVKDISIFRVLLVLENLYLVTYANQVTLLATPMSLGRASIASSAHKRWQSLSFWLTDKMNLYHQDCAIIGKDVPTERQNFHH
jgi:hypothetical protein